jgi:hypothetical protein
MKDQTEVHYKYVDIGDRSGVLVLGNCTWRELQH